jgi:hypothetical protein
MAENRAYLLDLKLDRQKAMNKHLNNTKTSMHNTNMDMKIPVHGCLIG